MTEQALLDRLNHVETKVNDLVERYTNVQKELSDVQNKNVLLKETVKKQNQQINNFQNQYKISKIVASIAPDAENTEELRKKIDEYIVEIQKCINFLEK